MTSRKPMAQKLLLLGLDGMDPRLTRKYVDEGKMPNTAEYIRRGAARHDLVMLGGHPTITPPMWTTLATGAYSNVHGITGFTRVGSDIDRVSYNFDSRLCKYNIHFSHNMQLHRDVSSNHFFLLFVVLRFEKLQRS